MAEWEVESETPASASPGGGWEVESETPAKPPAMFLSQDASGRMIAAPSTEYNKPEPQHTFGSRARAGVTGAYEEPLGISQENLGKYPWLKYGNYHAKALDAVARAPGAVLGAASGLAGDIYEGLGGNASWADRLQRDLNMAAQSPELPIAAPKVPKVATAIARLPNKIPIPGEAEALAAREARRLQPPPIPEEPSPNIPRQMLRQDAGVDLLPADTPHTLPAERRGLSAQGFGGPLSDISPETITHMRNVMEEQGFNANTLDQRLGEMSEHNMFGEITPSLEADMGAVAAPPGLAKREVIESLRQRGLEAPERVRHEFDRAFGESENLPQMRRIMEIERAREADPLYQRFRQTQITPTPEIDALLPRLEAAGVLQRANRALRIEGQPTTRGFPIAGEPPTIQNVPTAGAFQLALEHISDTVGAEILAGNRNEARRYTGLRNDLLSALDNHPNIGDTWRQARSAYARPAAIQDAIQMGRNVLTGRIPADELPFLTAAYSEPEMRALRVGMRDHLEQMLGKRDSLTAETINTVLSPNNIQKMRWAIGDAQTDQLVGAISHERHMHTAPTRIHGGSQTALRTEAQKRWTVEPQKGGVTVHDVTAAAHRPVRTGVTKAAEKVAERFGAARRAKEEARMARLREEASRIFTLQGPERDAVARHLLGDQPPPLRTRAEGGRVNDFHRARHAFIKKQEGGELSADELSPDDQAAMMPETYVNPAVKSALFGDVASKIPQSPSRFSMLNAIRGTIRGAEHAPLNVVESAKSTATLPQRAIEASQDYLGGGDYDPGPAVEAALLSMGTGAIAGVPLRAGETVLGAGAVRGRVGKGAEPVYKGTEGATNATEAVQAAAADQAAGDVTQGVAGAPGGGEGLRQAQLQAERRAAGRPTLPGLPTDHQIVDGELFTPGPVARAHEVAEQYMADKDFGLPPPEKYHEIDKVHARAIAKAYDKVKHNPNDPKVKASYDALIKETLAQYRAIRDSGLEITPVGATDYPYHGNPRAMTKDVADNNHMAFFRSTDGFGSGEIASDHPMLQPSGEKIGDYELLNNDLFRIVHDYFGHVKNGYGFRAAGEDNAFRAHAAMYSPEARPAMTTETRGQNSWLNYGPHGDKNRTANVLDTVYAEQKAGLMPDWTMRDRGGYFEGEPVINAGVQAAPSKKIQTVADPYRMMYPGIYRNPSEIAREAAARVGPEDVAMKRLFGVTRGDLYQMNKGRVGNEAPNLKLAERARGATSAENIQTPANTQRLIDIMQEAGRHEGLRNTDAWYVMDPMYWRLREMFGPEEAARRYRHLNTSTSMASPGSDVLTEIQRGTAAHWLHSQGRFNDFLTKAGLPESARGADFPADMRYIGGHPYHRTAQAGPMQKYFDTGAIQSAEPKVPLYAHASGVPETGFQTTGPVGDAHFSRGTGLTDTRKGPTDVQGSFTRSEYQTLQPWWQHKVAGKLGIQSVPAQARLWNVLGPQTGVESELGAPKLELFAKQIMKAARRLGVSPETARDLILSGKAGAGVLAGGVLAPSLFGSDERAGGGRIRGLIGPTIARYRHPQ